MSLILKKKLANKVYERRAILVMHNLSHFKISDIQENFYKVKSWDQIKILILKRLLFNRGVVKKYYLLTYLSLINVVFPKLDS